MALYSYKAMDARGRTVSGEMNALNPVDLETRLKRLNLDFINGTPITHGGWFKGAPVSRRELINFFFHLEQLTRAGVPILDALTDLRDSVDQTRFREIVASVIESIEGGRPLSQAMAEHPDVFNLVLCNLVRSGEHTGRLPEVLRNVNESLKWEDELASYAKRLVAYPAIVGTVVLGVTLFLMVYLVPQMSTFIRSMGHALPAHTRLLIAVSDSVLHYWYVIIGAPVAGALALRHLARTRPAWRYRVDRTKLRLPLFGPILRKIILSRFASVFAMMYASGIAIIEVVRTTQDIVGNSVVRDGLGQVGDAISQGKAVTAAFQDVGLFPPLVIRMLRVGESTGALDAALLNVSYFYNRDVKESIARVQAVVEPALTVLLGLLLLWVMLSVLGPIYDIITRLKT
jgi:type IV pilus assembly protein PilC